MRARIPILIAAVFAIGTAGATDVYRTVEADGTPVYSDKPESSQSLLVERTVTGSQTTTQDTGGVDISALSTEERSINQLRCELMKKTLTQYESSDYLVDDNPDGTQRVLSDQEMAATIDKAQADVERFCI
ncbi:MAG: DUF4124 domain-containing protein [Gammaproteobacteria bacterium]